MSVDLAALPIRERVAFIRGLVEKDPALAGDQVVLGELEALDAALAANPLEAFEPHRCRVCKTYEGVGCGEHSVPQLRFFEARTKIIAAFAGNQFGKTTGLVIKGGLECLGDEWVPGHLQRFKTLHGAVFGWILCPTEDKIFDSLLPTFRDWLPAGAMLGGSWEKAWNGARMMLSFANGSTIHFKTYKQDASTLGGARLHWVGYDEPPPRGHRDEAMTRLVRYGGYEIFAMTPLKTNTGWIRRDIFKKREAPEITVVKASIHDNPTLNEDFKQHMLGQYASDLWRQAREFGDFIDVGGMVYQEFDRAVTGWESVKPDLSFIGGLDIVVGIDPGVRNAGFVFAGTDRENTLWVFDELLLQDKTPSDYADAIWRVLDRWELPRSGVSFVIDPAARQRAQVNAETVESALARLGIYCEHGQNSVEAGVQQVRLRLQHQRLKVNPACRGLRDEADEYAAEDRDDGEFKPIKQNDHRLDALRYVCMRDPFDPVVEQEAPNRSLGWEPGHALPARLLKLPEASPPLGSMS